MVDYIHRNRYSIFGLFQEVMTDGVTLPVQFFNNLAVTKRDIAKYVLTLIQLLWKHIKKYQFDWKTTEKWEKVLKYL